MPRKSKIKATVPLGLNAVGKPFSPQYDPNYRMKYKPSNGHLRAPYGSEMRFVGDPPKTNDERRKHRRRTASRTCCETRDRSLMSSPGRARRHREAIIRNCALECGCVCAGYL
jgi:hypothetical protein